MSFTPAAVHHQPARPRSQPVRRSGRGWQF